MTATAADRETTTLANYITSAERKRPQRFFRYGEKETPCGAQLSYPLKPPGVVPRERSSPLALRHHRNLGEPGNKIKQISLVRRGAHESRDLEGSRDRPRAVIGG